MHIRLRPETAAGFLLAGMAVLHGLLGGSGGASLQQRADGPALPSPTSKAGKTLEWCRVNVTMIHDVHWASMCSVVAEEQRRAGRPQDESPDDSPDCTLPEERARPLNVARAKAEQQCLEEATGTAFAVR